VGDNGGGKSLKPPNTRLKSEKREYEEEKEKKDAK